MSDKKQFGVWMDGHHATVVGKANSGEFAVIGHVKNPQTPGNSNENTANNHEVTLRNTFFKEIAALMQNVDEIHVTGTGDSQEQFIHFLAETPQYKNAEAKHSTSTKMTDDQFTEMVRENFS